MIASYRLGTRYFRKEKKAPAHIVQVHPAMSEEDERLLAGMRVPWKYIKRKYLRIFVLYTTMSTHSDTAAKVLQSQPQSTKSSPSASPQLGRKTAEASSNYVVKKRDSEVSFD